jgi:hypothetical protein
MSCAQPTTTWDNASILTELDARPQVTVSLPSMRVQVKVSALCACASKLTGQLARVFFLGEENQSDIRGQVLNCNNNSNKETTSISKWSFEPCKPCQAIFVSDVGEPYSSTLPQETTFPVDHFSICSFHV